MPRRYRVVETIFIFAIGISWQIKMGAQAPPLSAAASSQETARGATLIRANALRDDFVQRIHVLGLSCPLAVPTMVVEFTPSFGDYDDVNNRLATSDWTMLPPEQKAFFFQLAGPAADDQAAHAVFEDAIHRWMLVHELAHWWQTCKRGKLLVGPSVYQLGVEADRITVAYWRNADPGFPAKMASLVQGLVDRSPNPMPAGQALETYFNQNYQSLGPATPWFAAHMILTAYRETPEPSFAQTLALSKK
jgi:hypothetical protein